MATVPPGKWAIGIDLGTANIRIAVLRDGQLEDIPDEGGDYSIPSYVGFEDHRRTVGASAKNRATSNPEYTVHSIKRLLGRKFDETQLRVYTHLIGFHAQIASTGEVMLSGKHRGFERRVSLVEILAMLLFRAKTRAEFYLGGSVTHAVVGIPATFGQTQRHQVEDALRAADLTLLDILPSPAAISIGRFFASTSINWGRNCIVIDLGAGFCSVGVVVIEDSVVEVKAVRSDNYLGGNDFDNRLVNHLVLHAGQKGINIHSSKRSLQRLRKAAEAAKIALSYREEYRIILESIADDRTFDYVLTRTQFEEWCNDLFRSTILPVEAALQDAKLDKSQIHEIILAGASTRIPRLKKIWEDYFNGKRAVQSVNPDNIEVRGLALQAAVFSQDRPHPALDKFLLLNVSPLSLGIQNTGGLMDRLVYRQTTIPTIKSEIYLWKALSHGLETMDRNHRIDPGRGIFADDVKVEIGSLAAYVRVFEGERQWTPDNQEIGKVDISSLLPPVMTGDVPLEIAFEVDRLQRLQVTVLNRVTKASITSDISQNDHISTERLISIKELLQEYEHDYKKEAARLSQLGRLEDRLQRLHEGILGIPESDVGSWLTQVNSLIAWVDKSQEASIEQLQVFERQVDALDAEIEHQTSEALPPQNTDKAPDVSQMETTTNSRDDSEGTQVMSAQNDSFSKVIARQVPPTPGHSPDVGSEADQTVMPFNSKASDVENENPAREASTARIQGLDADLELMFSTLNLSTQELTDADLERVTNYLHSIKKPSWASIPRIYTILRLINQLDDINLFLREGLTDMWLPFSLQTLPRELTDAIQSRFIEIQSVVYSKSKSFQLETGARRHAHFSANDPFPLRSIAKLGFGAHGSVDKVVSTLTHKIYARKLFRKSKGLKKEDVQTFRNELDVLKRVSFRHCISLVATYSDPKFFGLLMSPVGDCNLEIYYDAAIGHADKLSLVRSFFGCLASAVAYLHAKKIRHRDIKPQNIIVRGDEVLLADFGIAFNWENLTGATTTADSGKTLVYAAPEVLRVEPRNEAADVWSLGCVFFEMATVLHGKPIVELRRYFLTRSDSRGFHANLEYLEPYSDSLRNLPPAAPTLQHSGVAFDWALAMLKENPAQRIKASALAEEIVHESMRKGVLFSCVLCRDSYGGHSTTDDDGAEDDDDPWAD
ncbi:Hsp70 protein-domain-containing protein [Podospora australis]|uniref:Hsp70 protein-domain-containing protein n=1 Tax=Podospora australis TaxID=1536484 RepID=A0AAN6WJG9_9PEZI|nr:Hsp70 protein-domain-containing protein [Podospora australis]